MPSAADADFSFDQDLDIMASLLSIKSRSSSVAAGSGGGGGGAGSEGAAADFITEFEQPEDIELEKSVRHVLAITKETPLKDMKLLLKLTYDKWRAERRKNLELQLGASH